MHRTTRIKITELNPHLICVLCGGYYIDASTIIECLHSFCRTCIVRYLESSKYCPICDVMVHKTKPLQNVKSDKTLQDLVYKLVPGLYKGEMKRRRDLYTAHPDAGRRYNGPSEEKGDEDQDRLIYTYDEKISLSLELYSECVPDEALDSDTGQGNPDRMKKRDVRYLQCPAAVTIGHLKKFIRMKFDLPHRYKIDIFHSFEPLDDVFTLMDVAYIYTWRRRSPLRLIYTVFELTRNNKRKCEEEHTACPEKQKAMQDDMPVDMSCTARSQPSPAESAKNTTAATVPQTKTVSSDKTDDHEYVTEPPMTVKQTGKDPKDQSVSIIKKNTSKYTDRISYQAPKTIYKSVLSKQTADVIGLKPLEDVNGFANNGSSVYDFTDSQDSPATALTAPSVGAETGSKVSLKQMAAKKRKLQNGKLSYGGKSEKRVDEQVIPTKVKGKEVTKNKTPKEKKQSLFDIRGKVKSSKFNGIYTKHVLNGHMSN